MSESRIRLIAGLGNPGTEYAQTRHNVGFMLIDALTTAFPTVSEMTRSCSGQLWTARVRGENLQLLKPMMFMNLSGDSLLQAQKNFGLKPEEMLIVYDDLDLPTGNIRLRKSGSAGGHNGMASIIEKLGTSNIPRLRIGIGQEEARRKQVDFVLSPFDADELLPFVASIQQATEMVKLILARGIQAAMTQFNKKVSAPVAQPLTEILS